MAEVISNTLQKEISMRDIQQGLGHASVVGHGKALCSVLTRFLDDHEGDRAKREELAGGNKRETSVTIVPPEGKASEYQLLSVQQLKPS